MRDPRSLTIRRITAAELDAAGQLTLEAYAPFITDTDDGYLPQLRDVGRRDREAEVYVALVEGQTVGCVTSCPADSPWREVARPEEGEFRMLAVHPSARGLGVGRALVETCEHRASSAGASGMALSSLGAMTDAHRLYERLGYRRAAQRDWSPVAGVDLIVYAKELLDQGVADD